MHLKRISLEGFKSFAERVHFDFSPGVTCIVGPNGCGKSNVVDAFKWVLGEQSAKLLRGRQMTDMIFNGSSSRRSSGLAQVDLIFDNTDRALAFDHDTVRVTRKLYRSGESEYLINKEVARLKDVRDLFLDTGVGADAYSVIEQGRVDVLLEASHTERRAIFEEAAGISKYKVRKRETQRKLDRTQQNLLRVEDIVEEVQKRLRSVKLQAGKARNFKIYDDRLRELRAGFSMAEFHRLTETIDAARRNADTVTDESTAERTAIDRNETESAKLNEQIDAIAAEISETDRELMRARSEIATNDARIDAAGRRIEEQTALRDSVASRIEQLRIRKEESGAQLATVQESAVILQRDTQEHDARIRELCEQDQELARELTGLNATVEDEKDGLIDLVRRSTQLRNEVTALNEQRKTLETEQGKLGDREAAIRAELADHLARRDSLDSRLSEIAALIEAETTRLDEKRAEARRMDAKRAELTETLSAAKQDRSALESRLHVLDELHRKMEGVGEAVRRLLEDKTAHPDDSTLAGICGMVGELFEADVEHARVIEAAIGELDQNLVVTDCRAFLAGRERLSQLPGRLTVLCLDKLPPVYIEHEYASHPGFVADAVDLVRCHHDYEQLAKHLLGKTVVVDTLDHALAMAKQDISGRRFVTQAGELVDSNGSISLGPPSSRAGLIARKSERRQTAAEIEGVHKRIAALADELEQAAVEAAHLDDIQQELRNAVYEANTARVEANAGLESVNDTIRRLTEERPLIAGEVAQIEQQIAETKRRASESAISAGELEELNTQREQAIAAHNERIELLSVERDRTQHKLTEARVAVAKLAEKRAATAESINQLRHAIRTSDESIATAERERDDAQARVADSEESVLAARERLEELGAEADRLEATGVQLRRESELARLECEQLAAQTKQRRTKLEDLDARLHQIQLDMQEAVVRRDELAARVKEELDLDLVHMYESYDHGEQDWDAVEAEITELRQKIQRLGHVNLDAIDEQAELEQRDEFLCSQRQDLEDSRRELESLIKKLDDESIERFTRTFEAIRENFRDLFRKLFGGGKADIILEDPDDILESGIEVMAKPPGKELQRISLMSGGEKTMTAIALVMSIFRARPAPFAILDEVDAALDEANNVRFNSIVQEFLDRSQFIVVTHSKRTMSIADQLYGVTMQEPGVSARVSVKFAQDSDQSAVA